MRFNAAPVLGYRVLPTSILVLVTYFAFFISFIITDALPNVPKQEKQGGLNAKQAYEDLRHITAHPHPYNSHANDHVRGYLLKRLRDIAQKFPHVEIYDDMKSNGSWAAGMYGVYFEGTNLLVRINGTESSSTGGVLFSAHYDSVSTAPGATDDGMGVVTALQLVQFFAKKRTPRTAVFNINNGEEDWLNGAHAFLEHPWSNVTSTFLNLEGAAAGGRPILFRATSTAAVRAFGNTKRVPHPHANVLSADGFARGFIRSGTDYSVYTSPGPQKGMDGLDLAFYKGRSKYHTKYDAVPFTLGGEKSLWSMMEVARGVGLNLLTVPVDKDEDSDERVVFKDDGNAPVYLDLFKSLLVVFPISSLLTFNIVVLIVGPIILFLLFGFEKFYVHRREQELAIAQADAHPTSAPAAGSPLLRHDSRLTRDTPHLRYVPRMPVPGHLEGDEHETESSLTTEGERGNLPKYKEGRPAHWAHTLWMHLKFWVALVVVFGLLALLMWGYVVINPFALHSSPYTVLFSFASLTYLALTYTLTFPSWIPFYHPKFKLLLFADAVPPPAQQQKLTIFIHLYIFTWFLLVLSTIGITKLHPGVGSGYLFSIWNVSVGGGSILAAIEAIVLTYFWTSEAHILPSTTGRESYEDLPGEESSRHLPHRPNPFQDTERHLEDVDADERTPLIPQSRYEDGSLYPSRRHLRGEEEEGGEVGTLGTWWWIPQFLVSVPLPVMLFGHVTMIILDGMAQTQSDGPSPWSVYSGVALFAALLVLPLAPFAYKLRPFRPLTLFVVIVFALSTLYAWVIFPFSVNEPLKIYFQQSVRLDTIANTTTFAPPTAVTVLIGPKRYLRPRLLKYLPSAQDHVNTIACGPDPLKRGLTRCEWESGLKMIPSPGFVNSPELALADDTWSTNTFFNVSAKRTSPWTAHFRIRGRNTRSCRVYFDSQSISRYEVFEPGRNASTSTGRGMQKGYEVPEEGVKELRLWSRTWEKEFMLDVEWGNRTDTAEPEKVEGRVACEWNEYESALVDSGPFGRKDVVVGGKDEDLKGGKAKIPALEEVLAFLPDWATVTKASDGLVEVWAPFVI